MNAVKNLILVTALLSFTACSKSSDQAEWQNSIQNSLNMQQSEIDQIRDGLQSENNKLVLESLLLIQKSPDSLPLFLEEVRNLAVQSTDLKVVNLAASLLK